MKTFSLKSIASWTALFCLLALFSACHPRTVVREGVRMPYNEAAKLDFQSAEKLYKQGKKTEAIRVLNTLIKNYPSSDYTDNAEAKLGDIYFSDGKFQEASLHYKAAADFMFSDVKTPATFRLGLCQLNLHQDLEGAKTLKSVADRYTDPVDRLEIYTLIAQAYEKINDPISALPFYVSIYLIFNSHQDLGADIQTKYAKIPPRDKAYNRVLEIIAATEDLKALEKIASQYGTSFPAQHALYRLARLELDQGMRSPAENNLEDLVRKFPRDPVTASARSLLKGLQMRYLVNENHIGVLLPLTGAFKTYGEEALNGIELAVSLMADRDPHSEVKFIIKDTQSNPEKVEELINQLIVEEQVIGIIGPLSGTDAAKAAKVAEGIGVPLITLAPLPQSLTQNTRFVFQDALSHQQEVRALVGYVDRLIAQPNGAKRFGILYPNHAYGVSMRDLFWDEVIKQGGKITACEAYNEGQTDFTEEFKKMVGLYYREARDEAWKQAYRDAKKKKRKHTSDIMPPPVVDFDALFIPDQYKTATIVADHLPYFDIQNVILVGGSLWNHPGLVERSEKNVRGAIFTAGFFNGSSQPMVRTFVDNFVAAFNYEPNLYGALGYDTAEMMIQVLQPPHNVNRDALRQALLDLKGFNGVTGKISFSPTGEAMKKPFLLTVKDDKIVEVQNP